MFLIWYFNFHVEDGHLLTLEWWSGRRSWSLILVDDPVIARRETISIGVSSIHPCNHCLYWGVTSVEELILYLIYNSLWGTSCDQRSDVDAVVDQIVLWTCSDCHPIMDLHNFKSGFTQEVVDAPTTSGHQEVVDHTLQKLMTLCIEVSYVTRVTFIV